MLTASADVIEDAEGAAFAAQDDTPAKRHACRTKGVLCQVANTRLLFCAPRQASLVPVRRIRQ